MGAVFFTSRPQTAVEVAQSNNKWQADKGESSRRASDNVQTFFGCHAAVSD